MSAVAIFKLTQLKFHAEWRLHKQGNLSMLIVLASLQLFQRAELLNMHRHPWTKNELQRIRTLRKVVAKFR